MCLEKAALILTGKVTVSHVLLSCSCDSQTAVVRTLNTGSMLIKEEEANLLLLFFLGYLSPPKICDTGHCVVFMALQSLQLRKKVLHYF